MAACLVMNTVADVFAGEGLETLLGRPLRMIPVGPGEEILRGARVLVTGAGGSVGVPLVARLLARSAAHVVALDHHEASLFALGRVLPRDAPVDLRLADVRHVDKIRRILDEARPDVLFHLAAYKHVPLGEREPDEPISVNVVGSRHLARSAIAAGVKHLVYPSSDKAVNPPSIYGATKRLAETLWLAQPEPDSQSYVVRYVNIIGSQGSVLETFVQQARRGAPLTLTDPRMTRYWMAMDEALDLLTHSIGLESGSRTLLDVGEAIPVEQMARRLYRLVCGHDAQPEVQITGARPGERLFEELASASETLEPAGESPVFHVVHSRAAQGAAQIDDMVDELADLVAVGALDDLRRRVMELAQALQ